MGLKSKIALDPIVDQPMSNGCEPDRHDRAKATPRRLLSIVASGPWIRYTHTTMSSTEVKARRMNIEVHQLSAVRKESILEAVSACLKRFDEISFAYAYGSFTGDGPFRDLDIAVYVHPKDLPKASFRFEDRLCQDLKSALRANFPLDVRVMNEAPIAFQYHVIRGRLLLEQCSASRIEVVCRIIQRYLDLKPVLDHHTREAFLDATGSRSGSIEAQ